MVLAYTKYPLYCSAWAAKTVSPQLPVLCRTYDEALLGFVYVYDNCDPAAQAASASKDYASISQP